MPDLIIYGASDDLVEVEGAFEEEFNVYGRWLGRVVAPDGAELYVFAEFDGEIASVEWTLGVCAGSEPFPKWPIRFGNSSDYDDPRNSYSFPNAPALVIDVPEGTVVTTEGEDD